jgi:uncharacterized membrane protein YwzB
MFAPAVLAVIAVIVAVRESWWALAALPFIWLGSICAQPNLNLANGCLAYVAMVVGFAVTAFFRPLGFAILGGAMSGFYVSAVEKWIRMRPAPEAEPDAPPNSRPPSQSPTSPEVPTPDSQRTPSSGGCG